jgi:hypothetical protein
VRLRAGPSQSIEHHATTTALRSTARRALACEAADLGPLLLAEPGVGAITAAAILNAWSHLGRIRTESTFAMLAYAKRREAEGKTPRETKRCLKRHLARRLFGLPGADGDRRLTDIEASS